ncbi:MAG TPA: EamA family transporter [Zeimonas sp.]|nr:EamA family transporter [Zeimonas sp.]
MQTAARNAGLATWPVYAALALTALLWSSNFVIGRAVRGDVTPVTLNFLRWLLALGVLLPFTVRDLHAHRATLLRHWRLLALLGLTGIAAFQTLCYVALTTTTALNTILLLSLAPLAIVLVSWLANRERVTRSQLAGLAISLAGTAVLVAHGDAATLAGLRLAAGDLWMLVAVALWAIYSVLVRRRPPELPPLALHTCSVATGTLWMLPAFAWQAADGVALPTGTGAWAAVAFIAVFSSAIAHALWVWGVAAIGPNRAGVFIHLMPLFGAVLAVAFLGEVVAPFHVAGAALVLSGVFLAGRK